MDKYRSRKAGKAGDYIYNYLPYSLVRRIIPISILLTAIIVSIYIYKSFIREGSQKQKVIYNEIENNLHRINLVITNLDEEENLIYRIQKRTKSAQYKIRGKETYLDSLIIDDLRKLEKLINSRQRDLKEISKDMKNILSISEK